MAFGKVSLLCMHRIPSKDKLQSRKKWNKDGGRESDLKKKVIEGGLWLGDGGAGEEEKKMI